jgi:hypothetical protein
LGAGGGAKANPAGIFGKQSDTKRHKMRPMQRGMMAIGSNMSPEQ